MSTSHATADERVNTPISLTYFIENEQRIVALPNEPQDQEWVEADSELVARKKYHLWPLTERIPIQKVWIPLLVYAVVALTSFLSWQQGRESWAVSQQSLWHDHQVWRALLACFAHADFVHLLSNAPIFIVFGTLLYGYFGRVAFPLLAFVAGALANAATVLFYAPHTQLLGASGVNYAMVGMWLVYFLARGTGYSWLHRGMRALAFSLVVLVPSTYEVNTSYAAHGFGFLFGILLALGALRYLHEIPGEKSAAPAGMASGLKCE